FSESPIRALPTGLFRWSRLLPRTARLATALIRWFPREKTVARSDSPGVTSLRWGVLFGLTVGPYLSNDPGHTFQFLLADLVDRAHATLHVGRIPAGGATRH